MSSSNKAPRDIERLPDNMVTPIVSLKDLGQIIAKQHSLPKGQYDLVIEYRFGPGRFLDGTDQFSAMAITFGGLGLRRSDKPGPLSIDVVGLGPEAKRPAKKRPAAKG